MSIKAYMYRGLNCCTTPPGDPPMKIFPISFLEADGRMGRGKTKDFMGGATFFFGALLGFPLYQVETCQQADQSAHVLEHVTVRSKVSLSKLKSKCFQYGIYFSWHQGQTSSPCSNRFRPVSRRPVADEAG